MTTIPTPDASQEQQEPEPKLKPVDGTTIVAAVIMGIILIACIGVGVSVFGGSDADETTFRASSVTLETSLAGRVEVTFLVTNTGDEYGTPTCTIQAEDADGFHVDSAVMTADFVLSPQQTHRFSGITDISALGVTRVIVEC